MSEFRQDPITGRWVVIATERAGRPSDFSPIAASTSEANCPFCEGNESQTPPEVLARREPQTTPDQPGWRVRVVPNKFPALGQDETPVEPHDGFFRRRPGIGAHEVIIESPHHERSLARLGAGAIAEVLEVYRDRLLTRRRDPQLVHPLIFKNVGAAAGASLEHSHSQLIVSPIVPPVVAEELAGALAFYQARQRCVFCEMLAQEVAETRRLVVETPNVLAFCPYASRSPFEAWIVPRRHASHFETISDPLIQELGEVLQRVLQGLEVALESPPYNQLIHTAPFVPADLPYYHWHLEIIPRLTQVAGFEWGSGVFINPVPPEEGARMLRAALGSLNAPSGGTSFR
ncbi:MAG: galactose-1-phosphate uridylyltransferase [Planctomycetales bacterium]